MNRLIASILVLMWINCAPATHVKLDPLPPVTPWPPAGAHWIEVQSERFILRTDFDQPTAALLLAQIESDVPDLRNTIFLANGDLHSRPTLFIFSDEFDRKEVCGFSYPGFNGWNDSVCFARQANPVAVRVGLANEIVSTLSPSPYWLKVGIADYISRASKCAAGWCVDHALPKGDMTVPLLTALMQVHDAYELQPKPRAVFEEMSEALLQTMLADSSELKLTSRLQNMLVAMRAGTPSSEAWSKAFAGVSNEDVVHAYQAASAAAAPSVIPPAKSATYSSDFRILSEEELRLMSAELSGDRAAVLGFVRSKDSVVSDNAASWAEQHKQSATHLRKPPRLIAGASGPSLPKDKLQKLRGQHGVVLTKIRVEPSGVVSGCQILRSSIPDVDDDIVRLVLQWRFEASNQTAEYLQPFSFTFN